MKIYICINERKRNYQDITDKFPVKLLDINKHIIYIGSPNKFCAINVTLAQRYIIKNLFTLQYFDSLQWKNLPFDDQTGRMTSSGAIKFIPPPNWSTYKLGKIYENYYWIKLVRISKGISPISVTNITLQQHFDNNPTTHIEERLTNIEQSSSARLQEIIRKIPQPFDTEMYDQQISENTIRIITLENKLDFDEIPDSESVSEKTRLLAVNSSDNLIKMSVKNNDTRIYELEQRIERIESILLGLKEILKK